MATHNSRRRREGSSNRRVRTPSNDFLGLDSKSLVEICGRYWSKCGYCKPSTKTSLSYGLIAKRLTCADYQELIDRGWRRSGTFVYKPVMQETCCPQYTIRLDATNFKPSKSQRHVLNRIKRYLDMDAGNSKSQAEDAKPSKTAGHGSKGNANDAGVANSHGTSRNGVPSGKAAGEDSTRNRKGKGRADDGRKDVSGGLVTLSKQVTYAAAAALANSVALSAITLEPGWESNLEKWTQVKPIRSKACAVAGGGFYTTVALSMASAARKRGWKPTGDGGGAVLIAEAIAELIRRRLEGSTSNHPSTSGSGGISVAPNGYINFTASVVEGLAAMRQAMTPSPTPVSTGATEMSLTSTAFEGDKTTQLSNSLTQEASTIDSTPLASQSKRTEVGTSRGDVTRRVMNTNDRAMNRSVPAGFDKKGKGSKVSVARDPNKGAGSGLGLTAPVNQPSTTEGVTMSHVVTGNGAMEASAVAAAAAPMEWLERQGGDSETMDVEAPTFSDQAAVSAASARAGGTNSAPSNGNASGLASLPRLDPSVSPHKLTVSTVPARVTDEVFDLYRKYQMGVHGDRPADVTRDQFRRFLVDTPLIRHTKKETATRGAAPPRRNIIALAFRGDTATVTEGAVDGKCDNEVTYGLDSLSVPYGSYHQLYRIDGTLVAVGVVDILPKCLSSVYCFYDPDYRALALGKLTALKETEFVREACELRPELRDYYMGYYIHTCPKMSYKGSYSPSFLMCPERLTWVPLELCRPVLDRERYACLSDLLVPPLSPTPDTAGSQRRELREGFEGIGGGDDDAMARAASGNAATGRRRLPSTRSSPPSLSKVSPPPSRCTVHSSRPASSGGHAGMMPNAAVAARAAADEASSVYEIPLLGGSPNTITLGDLSSQTQVNLRDILRLYTSSVGPNLARRIVLKFFD